MYDVIILGSGASGMSTALYTARSGLKTLVIDKNGYGGQLNNTLEIENFIGVGKVSGSDLSETMFEQMESFNVVSMYGDIHSVKKEKGLFYIETDMEDYTTKSLVVATGSEHRKLGVEGEEEYSGRGVSYCAICDGAFFKNKDIYVIGGGDSALEEGEYLTNFGSKVDVVHRRNELRATKILQDRFLEKENSGLLLSSQLNKIIGDGTKVTKVEIKDIDGNKKELEAEGVFIYVGANPNTTFLDKSLLDSQGYVLTDENMKTHLEGLFAVGDVRSNSKRQVATAVSDGAVCGLEVYKYLSEIK